jgi:Zn-dependent protease
MAHFSGAGQMPPAAQVGSTRTILLEGNRDKVIDCKCTNEMTARELRELTLSALALALAFGIAFEGGLRAILEPSRLILAFFFALVGVSLGFILHELGHRFVARRFDYFAEYSMWREGLMLALVCSLFGFVFAALLNTFYPATVFSLGAWINTWLAIFNLIPLGPLDGAKIIRWDRGIWSSAIGAAIVLLVMQSVIL